jgi:hypothetical protein
MGEQLNTENVCFEQKHNTNSIHLIQLILLVIINSVNLFMCSAEHPGGQLERWRVHGGLKTALMMRHALSLGQ